LSVTPLCADQVLPVWRRSCKCRPTPSGMPATLNARFHTRLKLRRRGMPPPEPTNSRPDGPAARTATNASRRLCASPLERWRSACLPPTSDRHRPSPHWWPWAHQSWCARVAVMASGRRGHGSLGRGVGPVVIRRSRIVRPGTGRPDYRRGVGHRRCRTARSPTPGARRRNDPVNRRPPVGRQPAFVLTLPRRESACSSSS
jgi:hypothetical protein